jgi:hypothetical protein
MLSRKQIERYRHDGYLYPFPALSPAELARHDRASGRYRDNYAEQIAARERQFAAQPA